MAPFVEADAYFTGDASGNWRLQGIVSMNAIIGTPSNNGLSFGISANAADVPEPMPSLLIGLGLLWVALRGRRGQAAPPQA